MTQLLDIEVMAHLKLVSLLYAEYNPTEEEITSIKLETLRILGFTKVNENLLKQIEADVRDPRGKQRKPKKGAMVNAFLDFGFTQQKVGEWFDLTPAAVSWHKQNPPKVEYTNTILQIMRDTNYRPKTRSTPIQQ